MIEGEWALALGWVSVLRIAGIRTSIRGCADVPGTREIFANGVYAFRCIDDLRRW